MENKKIKKIYFIPARAGSKGIPNKNSKLFNGKSLILWVIEIIISSGTADEVWVATNCPYVKSEINSLKDSAVKIFHRSETSASDESPTIDVVLEFLEKVKYNPNDYLILMQATSPLTPISLLKVLNDEIDKKESKAYLSCFRDSSFRWSEHGEPLDYLLNSKPRRQDVKGFLIESGAMYASSIGNIMNSKQLLSGVIKPIEVAKVLSVDIDTIEDWILAETLYKINNSLI